MVSFNLVKHGWNNLTKIANDGVGGLVDVFTPSTKDIFGQVRGYKPAPLPAQVPEILPEVVPDSLKKYAKYAKYAVIGVGALIVYNFIKK